MKEHVTGAILFLITLVVYIVLPVSNSPHDAMSFLEKLLVHLKYEIQLSFGWEKNILITFSKQRGMSNRVLRLNLV